MERQGVFAAFSDNRQRSRLASRQPTHFTFIQSDALPDRYGASIRSETMPLSRRSSRAADADHLKASENKTVGHSSRSTRL